MKFFLIIFLFPVVFSKLAQAEEPNKINCSGKIMDINSEDAVARPVTKSYTFDKKFIYFNDVKIPCFPEVESLRQLNGGKFVICESILKEKHGDVNVRLELDRVVSGVFDIKLSDTQFLIGDGSITKFQGLCGFADP